MLRQGWSGAVLSAVLMVCSAGAAVAQDAASKDEEIQDLKRRLELLEKKDKESAQTPAGSAVVSEPVEEKWYDKVHVGGGIRTEYRSAEVDTANGTKHTSDFTLDSGRLYTGGKISEVFSATLNAEFTANGASVLDAICQMKVMNEFQIFVGRMLPATDRSNSDGPYYLSTWDFPFLSDGFNAAGKLGDRDDGITFWGDVGAFKYWAGVYEGNDHGAPTATFGDRLLYSARVQYNFMDTEPGYYLQSTYYGDKRILAVGLVANYSGGATSISGGTPSTAVTAFGNVCLDFLWEDKIGDGVATVEAAYYYFGRHGYAGPATPGALAGPFDTGAGTGFLFSVAYLIPGKIGWGQFQPHIRYQGFNEAETNLTHNPTADNVARYDIGVNYVMMQHNARISLVYTHTDITGPKEFGMIVLGTQFQF